MSLKDSNEKTVSNDVANEQPRSPGRRALLSGAVKAAPVVLTLQSGAALARSSNLISSSTSSYRDGSGRTLCLNTDSVDAVDSGYGLYDLGEPASGHVTAINERDYRVSPRRRAGRVDESTMCMRGGNYYYRDRQYTGYGYKRTWREVKVSRGVLVSATAMTSFAGSIIVTDL